MTPEGRQQLEAVMNGLRRDAAEGKDAGYIWAEHLKLRMNF